MTQMPSSVGVSRMKGNFGDASSLPRPKTGGQQTDNDLEEAKAKLAQAINR